MASHEVPVVQEKPADRQKQAKRRSRLPMRGLAAVTIVLSFGAFATAAAGSEKKAPAPVAKPASTATSASPTGQPAEQPTEPAIQKAAVPPGEMVLVPAGEFRMGSEGGKEDERPIHTVVLDAYKIDKTEVTVAQYRSCVGAGKCTETPAAPECNSSAPDRQDYPENCVLWQQADAYCRWAGRRLPTEAEWEKAARGTDGRTFPWGNEVPTCDYAVMKDGEGQGCGRQSMWPAGSKPRGASPYGALDMAGNVWEWVADWYAADYYASRPAKNPMGPETGETRVLRGGSYSSDATILRSTGRGRFEPSSASKPIGFRCAADAK